MLIFAERGRKSMSKLHVCSDETWLFKVVEGNVFDRFLSNPHYFRLLYPHCALKTRRKKSNQLIVEKANRQKSLHFLLAESGGTAYH